MYLTVLILVCLRVVVCCVFKGGILCLKGRGVRGRVFNGGGLGVLINGIMMRVIGWWFLVYISGSYLGWVFKGGGFSCPV